MNKVLNLIGLTLIVFLLSCSNKVGKKSTATEVDKTTDIFDFGKAENGTYENKFFGLKFNYDNSWKLQEKGKMEELSKSGQDLIAGDDEALKTMLKAAEVNTPWKFLQVMGL